MFCTKCGAEIKPGSKFCSRCGTPVTTISGSRVNTQPGQAAFAAAAPAKNSAPSNSGGAASPFSPLVPHIIPAKEEPSPFAKAMPSWSPEPPAGPIVRPWTKKNRRVR